MPQINPDQAKNLKAFYTGLLSSLNSYATHAATLGGDFLTMFNSLKEQCDSVLKKLGPIDQAPAALEFDSMLSSVASAMTGTQAMFGLVLEQLSAARGKVTEFQTQMASAILPDKLDGVVNDRIAERVTAGELITKEALQARITAGELVPKEVHTEACSQAKLLGIEDGKKEVQATVEAKAAAEKTMGERRVRVEKAGIPIPTAELEAILGEKEEVFTAAETKAKTRVEFLNAKRISMNSAFRSKVWADDSAWAVIETAVNEVSQNRGGASEPFALPPAADRSKSFGSV